MKFRRFSVISLLGSRCSALDLTEGAIQITPDDERVSE